MHGSLSWPLVGKWHFLQGVPQQWRWKLTVMEVFDVHSLILKCISKWWSSHPAHHRQKKLLHSVWCKFNKTHTILLMEEILHHLGYKNPWKWWVIYHINWLAGFLPSTVVSRFSQTPNLFVALLSLQFSGTLARKQRCRTSSRSSTGVAPRRPLIRKGETLHSDLCIRLPSWKLTYPFPNHFWRWFSFSKGGIC